MCFFVWKHLFNSTKISNLRRRTRPMTCSTLGSSFCLHGKRPRFRLCLPYETGSRPCLETSDVAEVHGCLGRVLAAESAAWHSAAWPSYCPSHHHSRRTKSKAATRKQVGNPKDSIGRATSPRPPPPCHTPPAYSMTITLFWLPDASTCEFANGSHMYSPPTTYLYR